MEAIDDNNQNRHSSPFMSGNVCSVSHICPVNFDVTWLQSNTDAGFGVIPDSDDLKSQAVFVPYRCQFSWHTRRRHESRPVDFCAAVRSEEHTSELQSL